MLTGQALLDYDQQYATEIMDRMLLAAYGDNSRKGFESYFIALDVTGLCQHLNRGLHTGDSYLDIAAEYVKWNELQNWASTLSESELLELGYTHD